MKCPLSLLLSLVGAFVMGSPASVSAKPAHHESIEWATANSHRVILGKVIKVESIDKHDIVTVEVGQTLRGDLEPKADDLPQKMTFIVQEYCSGYARGWLEDGLPMMFFLVKIDQAKRSDQLPKGYQWVLHEDGNGNSAVLLGKSTRVWPGTIDVFTRQYEYLTDPAVIVKYVDDYARSIPPDRIVESISVDVPYETSAYRQVFPPEYPGNAFFLRVPVVGQKKAQTDKAQEVGELKTRWHHFMLLGFDALGCCVCISYLTRPWVFNGRTNRYT